MDYLYNKFYGGRDARVRHVAPLYHPPSARLSARLPRGGPNPLASARIALAAGPPGRHPRRERLQQLRRPRTGVGVHVPSLVGAKGVPRVLIDGALTRTPGLMIRDLALVYSGGPWFSAVGTRFCK
jgi:hypothetical protein